MISRNLGKLPSDITPVSSASKSDFLTSSLVISGHCNFSCSREERMKASPRNGPNGPTNWPNQMAQPWMFMMLMMMMMMMMMMTIDYTWYFLFAFSFFLSFSLSLYLSNYLYLSLSIYLSSIYITIYVSLSLSLSLSPYLGCILLWFDFHCPYLTCRKTSTLAI
jgi:hypothetical protein